MRLTRQLRENNGGRQERLRKTLLKYAVLLGIGVLYWIVILLVGAGLPCLFYELTGFRCPGCGVSRMLIAIGHLEFAEAFAHNRFLFVTGPLILLYLACVEGKYVLYGSRSMGKWEIFLWIEIGLALAFGVLRNTVFPW